MRRLVLRARLAFVGAMNKAVLAVLNVIGILVFALFAWFQVNDIDPAIYHNPSKLDAWLWFAFYALVALLFVAALVSRRVPGWLLGLAAVFCLVEMGRTAPGLFSNLFESESFTMTQESMSAESPQVELTREFFGALIALAAVGFLAWQQRRRGRPGSPGGATQPPVEEGAAG